MNLTGILSFYDESPSWLAAAVTGFSRVCDSIVACDGAYASYPGARPRSHPMQAEAVTLACEAAGVGCVVHRPKNIWFGDEVAKRNHCLRLAAALEPDWVLVFDADLHVMRCEPDRVRAELENTALNVASYTAFDAKDMLADEKAVDIVRNAPISTEWTSRTRDIFRWTPDLAYVGAHYMVQGTHNGKTAWLKASSRFELAPCLDLDASLVAVHRSVERAKVRRDSAKAYYDFRDRYEVENVDHLREQVPV